MQASTTTNRLIELNMLVELYAPTSHDMIY